MTRAVALIVAACLVVLTPACGNNRQDIASAERLHRAAVENLRSTSSYRLKVEVDAGDARLPGIGDFDIDVVGGTTHAHFQHGEVAESVQIGEDVYVKSKDGTWRQLARTTVPTSLSIATLLDAVGEPCSIEGVQPIQLLIPSPGMGCERASRAELYLDGDVIERIVVWLPLDKDLIRFDMRVIEADLPPITAPDVSAASVP